MKPITSVKVHYFNFFRPRSFFGSDQRGEVLDSRLWQKLMKLQRLQMLTLPYYLATPMEETADIMEVGATTDILPSSRSSRIGCHQRWAFHCCSKSPLWWRVPSWSRLQQATRCRVRPLRKLWSLPWDRFPTWLLRLYSGPISKSVVHHNALIAETHEVDVSITIMLAPSLLIKLFRVNTRISTSYDLT